MDEVAKLKAFISYSRKDEAFAQELAAGLLAAGFDPVIDRHDIAAGEEWEERLGRLIESADTVVFVVSPDSVSSDRCAWEIGHAERLKKRLLPIVWRTVAGPDVPLQLKRLNYIFFDKPHSFGPSLATLATALKTDLVWIREHTRYSEAANRWNARARADALLLRGDELTAAKEWLTAQPKYAPEPILLVRELISSSHDSELARNAIERQRLDQMAAALNRERAALRARQRLQAVAAVLLFCVMAGTYAWSHKTYVEEQIYWYWVMKPTRLTAATERKLSHLAKFKDCENGCPSMVVLAPENGTKIELFAIAMYETTFAEWDRCASAGACRKLEDVWGRNTLPVVNVTWTEATRYTGWLSQITGKRYSLPTNAQWEYANRAGLLALDIAHQGTANCRDCGTEWDTKDVAAPVGVFSPNNFGLHDMAGNVWEWLQDFEGEQRVVRGGSFNNTIEHIGAKGRNIQGEGYKGRDLGFRVVRDLMR